MVRGGTYFLAEPLLLGPEDSGTAAAPVVYRAQAGEEVTLSGGRAITNWRKGAGNLQTAELPGVKAGKWYFRQLFVGGKRQPRARTPNFDPKNPTTGGWFFVKPLPDKYKAKATKGHRGYALDCFCFRAGDIKRWPRSPEPEIHIFPAWGWVNAILSVGKIDFDAHVVHVKNRNCSQGLRPGNRYFVENVFEALDTPGEWYLDRADGKLHYWPVGNDFTGRTVVAPVLDHLIEIAGTAPEENAANDKTASRYAQHIVIHGFTFRHTKYSLEVPSVYQPSDATVRLCRARHCLIEDCRFLGVGGYAVRLSTLACDNHVLGNTVIEAGQGGVLMDGTVTTSQPKRNVVAGNRIERCGKIWKHVAGVYVTTGSDNRIAHNTITDVPRYGISLKTYRPGYASHGNVIEYNRLVRTNLETNDTGAIETLGRDKEDSGNVISHNIMLDSVGFKTTESGEILTPYYTWGIYLDDYSSGTRCHGNIVARTFRGGIHVHLGRNNVFENNILVDGRNQQFECNGREFMTGNRFVRNVVCWHGGNLIRINRYSDKVLSQCDKNLYWYAGPKSAEAGGLNTPKGPLAQWQAAGYDKNSLVADPLFVDAAKDDYRLKPDSPAFKLGFKPIDTERIGVRAYKRPEGLP